MHEKILLPLVNCAITVSDSTASPSALQQDSVPCVENVITAPSTKPVPDLPQTISEQLPQPSRLRQPRRRHRLPSLLMRSSQLNPQLRTFSICAIN
ncbi:hypothetical protein PUN28_016910 [Cardiocondyla obscurior]|uniref:Uncharacterized protein n=1 Tax=Cardiocondyla obscurior TaxID=286306 RepID=A0AAW2ERY4_9HYME